MNTTHFQHSQENVIYFDESDIPKGRFKPTLTDTFEKDEERIFNSL